MIIDLPRHLRSKKHGISKDKARKARGIHGLRKERSDKIDTSRSYQSYECPLCKIKTNRIHDHLYRSPHFLKNNPKKYHECLKNKILCEESLAIKLPVLTKKLPSYENKEQFVSVNVTSVNKGNILEFPSTDANNFAPKPNFTDFLEMFCLYLKSPSGGLKEGKAAINEMNQIRRMMEMLCPDPQQASYHLFFDLKKFQEVWFEHAKNKGYESGTKRSYLLSLTHFMDFILRSKLTPMLANVLPIDSFISAELICLCQKEISKWRSALKPEEADREYAIMIKDTEDVIPKDVFFQVQNSSFNNQIIEKTKQIHKTFIDKPEEYISNRTTFTNVRDSICFSLITNNISRSGAIANFKTDEYIRGSYSPTGSYIVMVKKHKTGRNYGPCQLIINADLKYLCDCYLNILRKAVPGNKADNFFITWSGCELSSGDISKQLNSFFFKCLPDKDRERNTCATLIRKSLLTFIYDNHPEMKSDLATLMKHKKETGQRWYYLNDKKKKTCQTSEQVTKLLFGSSPTCSKYLSSDDANQGDIKSKDEKEYNLRTSRKHLNYISESDSDFDEENLEVIPPTKSRPWDEDEKKELSLLFGNFDLSTISQKVIRENVKSSNILKLRSTKQIYDKLHHMERKKLLNSTESCSNKQKISFSYGETDLINFLFASEISGKSIISEEMVMETLRNNQGTNKIIETYTSAQLVAKVRYERSRVISQQKKKSKKSLF